jgi:hypothetical protein
MNSIWKKVKKNKASKSEEKKQDVNETKENLLAEKQVTIEQLVEADLINKILPKELLIRIFSYLDVVSLCRCAQVSKARQSTLIQPFSLLNKSNISIIFLVLELISTRRQQLAICRFISISKRYQRCCD